MADIDYAKIDLLVLDVDGVLTDGRITLTGDGDEIKSFHVRDGSGMKLWKREGRKLAIITGRGSTVVSRRAKELDVDICRLNVHDKLPVFTQVLEELDVSASRTAVMGDDLTDMPMMCVAGFSAAVADAPDEVKQAARYVTASTGGAGAVREVIELIFKEAGLWDGIVARYLVPAVPATDDSAGGDG